jgi:acyl carrier protein
MIQKLIILNILEQSKESECMNEQRLKKVLSNILDIPEIEINEQSSMKSISNWDSLKHIQLMTAIEEEFEVTLSLEDMIAMTNYPTIFKTVSAFEK